jgi:hypothetical protein
MHVEPLLWGHRVEILRTLWKNINHKSACISVLTTLSDELKEKNKEENK